MSSEVKTTKQETMLEWLKRKDKQLAKIFKRKTLHDYKVLGPLGLEDAPLIYVFIRLNKKDKGKWHTVPFD